MAIVDEVSILIHKQEFIPSLFQEPAKKQRVENHIKASFLLFVNDEPISASVIRKYVAKLVQWYHLQLVSHLSSCLVTK